MRTNSSKCKPDPRRAQIMRVKAQLARRIAELLAERGIPQTEAAALLGMPEPELSKLLRGQFGGFCLYELLKCFTRLGFDVNIVIGPRPDKRSTGRLSVTFA
jgi:predicted XRE-type DNA-binding protein